MQKLIYITLTLLMDTIFKDFTACVNQQIQKSHKSRFIFLFLRLTYRRIY